MDCKAVGMLNVLLGGGRRKSSDPIDFGVGFVFKNKIGSKVKKGDVIATIYHNENQSKMVDQIQEDFKKTVVKISATKSKGPDLIREVKIYFPKKSK